MKEKGGVDLAEANQFAFHLAAARKSLAGGEAASTLNETTASMNRQVVMLITLSLSFMGNALLVMASARQFSSQVRVWFFLVQEFNVFRSQPPVGGKLC